MTPIALIGEIVVEIMADSPGEGFAWPMPLTGPFPSGAPAIFAVQAARLGHPVAIVSAVGEDDFGRLCLRRLAADGVDVTAVRVDPDRPTGTAFVRYRPDGARDFVFNIRHSACGTFRTTAAAEAVLGAAGHLHVMGSALTTPDFRAANLDVARAVRARGGTVSFDPNLRKEMLRAPGVAAGLEEMLGLTDLFLPSGDELFLGGAAATAESAMDALLARGMGAVVHKRGQAGAVYRDCAHKIAVPAFAVDEIDPTGAGDCFGGAFVALWLRGTDLREGLTLAAAAGAHAVTRRGPMEGAADLATLRAFITERTRP